ncbi:hypothetical protein GGI1_24661 [Acidithiobacillus sp. GGI-221]|nr:hypothetical protein GGI1_24661 [Acidithiobacillus sp. GGI-221]
MQGTVPYAKGPAMRPVLRSVASTFAVPPAATVVAKPAPKIDVVPTVEHLPAPKKPRKPRIDHKAIAQEQARLLHASIHPATGWITGLWENEEKQRRYQVDLCQDLFGEWLLIHSWWRKSTPFGGRKKSYLGFSPSAEEINALLYDAALRRSRHGYRILDDRIRSAVRQ